MIKNKKTVDPKDDASTKVYQLETAMGAAIECFKGATAIVVPRTRFAPVKKCNDLLLLRSDAYIVTDSIPVLASGIQAAPQVNDCVVVHVCIFVLVLPDTDVSLSVHAGVA